MTIDHLHLVGSLGALGPVADSVWNWGVLVSVQAVSNGLATTGERLVWAGVAIVVFECLLLGDPVLNTGSWVVAHQSLALAGALKATGSIFDALDIS